MNNFETGEKLLQGVERHYEQMLNAYYNKWWNIVVRRVQETEELSLKAVLKIFGVEYPKVHDVGSLFVKFVKEKKLEVNEEVLERIKNISEKLAKERAPAFYGEKNYTEKDAKEAMKGAKEILEFCKKYFVK